MKTLNGIPLMVLVLAFGQPAMAQTAPAAAGGPITPPLKPSPTTAPSKPEIVEVTVNVDFTWKQDLLPLTEQDIKAFAERFADKMRGLHRDTGRGTIVSGSSFSGPPGPYLSIPRAEVRYEMLQPSTMPADLGAGWRFARITFLFHQRIDTNEGLQWALKVRDDRAEVQEILKRELESWLSRLDKSAGLTMQRKAGLEAQERECGQRLHQLNPDEQLRELARQMRELEIEQVGKGARERAMQNKIVEIRKQAVAKSAADPILKELQAIATIREEALKLAKEQWSTETYDGKNKAPKAEASLRDAQVKALEARVQVAQRQEAVAVAAGGDLLTRLTNDAAMLSIDLTEMVERRDVMRMICQDLEAKRGELESLIKKAREAMKNAQPWRIVSTPEPRIRPCVEDLRQESGPAIRERTGSKQ
jgi:hypothetical protein